ncbi:MAG: hypothetical protein FD156_868 [Nitrospirae bacterium]|nr:MAG: hypothetical protein FD156_868 [Nitrospirota bacterium]
MSLTFETNKHVLLTGSGFTRNFGGFLANEMWAWIFNDPKIGVQPKLNNLLKNDFDYESVYYKVTDGNDFNEDEKRAITEAIHNAYKKLDDKIKDYYSLGTRQPVNISDVCKFIDRFSGIPAITGNNNTKGFFFTLNQDLLIERYFSSSNMPALYVNQPTIQIYQNKDYQESTCSVTLALAADMEKTNPLSSSKFFYVKVHGSWNWYSSDGVRKMVIGRNKLNQINTEPILTEYSDIFREVLSSGNIRLFVIDYGFGDEHINQVIADAVEQNSLKLYVLNPADPAAFRDGLCKRPFGQTLFSGLVGYYPFDLSTVFPGSGGSTKEYELIHGHFFNAI